MAAADADAAELREAARLERIFAAAQARLMYHNAELWHTKPSRAYASGSSSGASSASSSDSSRARRSVPHAGLRPRHGYHRFAPLFRDDGSGALRTRALNRASYPYSRSVRLPLPSRAISEPARQRGWKDWILDWPRSVSRRDHPSLPPPWPHIYLRPHDEPHCPRCSLWAAYRVDAHGRAYQTARPRKELDDELDAWRCAHCGIVYDGPPPGIRDALESGIPAPRTRSPPPVDVIVVDRSRASRRSRVSRRPRRSSRPRRSHRSHRSRRSRRAHRSRHRR